MSRGPAVGSTTTPVSLGRLRAAIYVRVSTSDQNCELQIRDLRDYAAQHEWGVVGVYEDVISGVKAHRPALTALMNDARARKFDCLLVWKLDRFGRSLVDCLNRIRDLETDGVRFIAITQGPDMDERNPVSKLLLHVLGAAAEFERSLSWSAPALDRCANERLTRTARSATRCTAGRVGTCLHIVLGRSSTEMR